MFEQIVVWIDHLEIFKSCIIIMFLRRSLETNLIIVLRLIFFSIFLLKQKQFCNSTFLLVLFSFKQKIILRSNPLDQNFVQASQFSLKLNFFLHSFSFHSFLFFFVFTCELFFYLFLY